MSTFMCNRSHLSPVINVKQIAISYTKLFQLRPCSHLFRFAFRSRSSPVPLVRVAFTPGKIDWNGSGFGPVARSHLFRNATGTSSPVNTPPTPPTHQVFRLDVKVITCALIQHGCLACRVWVIPHQINEFLAIFAMTPSDLF